MIHRDFLLVSSIFGTISGSGTWLVDSGACRHMKKSQESLTSLSEEDSRLQVDLGDNVKYAVKGVGTTSFQLESEKPIVRPTYCTFLTTLFAIIIPFITSI